MFSLFVGFPINIRSLWSVKGLRGLFLVSKSLGAVSFSMRIIGSRLVKFGTIGENYHALLWGWGAEFGGSMFFRVVCWFRAVFGLLGLC
jgi:hypothetical protein